MRKSRNRRDFPHMVLTSCVLLLSIWAPVPAFSSERTSVSMASLGTQFGERNDLGTVVTHADAGYTYAEWGADGQITGAAMDRAGDMSKWYSPVKPRLHQEGVPVEVVVTGVEGPTTIFIVCGGELINEVSAQEGSQTVQAAEGECEIGVYKVFQFQNPATFIVREVTVPASDPIVLAIDSDDLYTATTMFRDENGDALTPELLGQISRRVHFSRATETLGSTVFTSVTSGHPATQDPVTYFPTFRYDIPNGLDYRLDWEVQSWPTSEARYGFKGRIHTFNSDIVFDNSAADLGTYTVNQRHPDSTGPIQMTQTIRQRFIQPEESPMPVFVQQFTILNCSNESTLNPPFVQTIHMMADPYPDFFEQENFFASAFDPANSIFAPDDEFSPDNCNEAMQESYVAAAPPVGRGHDGVFRAYRYDVGYGPGIAFGDTLDYALAPLSFVPRLVDDGGSIRLDRAPGAPNVMPSPTNWPLPAGLPPHSNNGPLVYAQLGDTRPVPMPYEIRDAAGELIASGDDLTELVALGSGPLPGNVPATLTADLVDPGVLVGGMPAGIAITLHYGHDTDNPGPPFVQRLTIEEDGHFTSAVSSGEGIVRFAFAEDGDDGIDSISAAVRIAGGKGDWIELDVIEEVPGEYRAQLPELPADVYALRLVATDGAGNQGEYVSDPGFEVYGDAVFHDRFEQQ